LNQPVLALKCIAEPEADIVVAVVRVVVVPIRNPAVVGTIVPVTTPFHTVRPALLSLPHIVANPFEQLTGVRIIRKGKHTLHRTIQGIFVNLSAFIFVLP